MKLTNRLGLPQAIVDAVAADDYSRGAADISVTSLLAPPRQVTLIEMHRDEIVEDAADRIWSLFGQIGHGILERANTVDLAEQRLFLQIAGWTISGKFDSLTLDDTRVLSDYKMTSVWKVRDGVAPIDYEMQLNVLAEILIANGHEVKAARIVALLRDWSKPEADRDPAYPQSQVAVLDVPLWPRADRLDFIERRIAAHQAARLNLPLCSDTDRWMKPPKWAVMKEGRTRAVKLFDTEGSAQDWIEGQKDRRSLYVEHRQAEPTRCKSYCPVGGTSGICQQWAFERSVREVGGQAVKVEEDEVL